MKAAFSATGLSSPWIARLRRLQCLRPIYSVTSRARLQRQQQGKGRADSIRERRHVVSSRRKRVDTWRCNPNCCARLQDREIKPLGSNKPIAAGYARDCFHVPRHGVRHTAGNVSARSVFSPERSQPSTSSPARAQAGHSLLVDVILKRVCADKGLAYSLSPEVDENALAYEWPQNVRELENCLERAAATANGPILTVDDLPPQVQTAQSVVRPAAKVMNNGIVPLAEIEKQAIISTLEQLNGDKQMAARLLGIGKTTLYRKLREYGIAENWAPSPDDAAANQPEPFRSSNSKCSFSGQPVPEKLLLILLERSGFVLLFLS